MDGKHYLYRKYYKFWQDDEDPEKATRWRALSRYDTLEEVERRLKLITSPLAY